MKAWVVGVTVAWLTATAHATTIDLATVLERTERFHPQLAGQRAQRTAAKERIGQAFSNYLPNFSLSAFGRYDYSNYVPVVVGTPSSALSSSNFPFSQSGRYLASLGVQQTIFDFGRTTASVSARRAEAAQTDAEVATLRNIVLLGAASAYCGMMAATRIHEVSKQAVDRAAQNLARSEALFHAGIQPEIDTLTARAQKIQAEIFAARAAGGIDLARAKLEAAVGTELEANAQLAEDGTTPLEDESAPMTQLTQEAIQHRPELVAAHHMVDASDAGLWIARSQHFPVLSVLGGVAMTGTDQARGPLFGMYAQLVLTLPLFSGLGPTHAVEEQRAIKEFSQQGENATTRRVVLEVRSAHATLMQAKDASALTADLQATAERQLSSATSRYDSGAGRFIDVVLGETTLFNARVQAVEAYYALAAARHALRSALGRPLVSTPGSGKQ